MLPAPVHAVLPIAILALWALEIDRVRLRDMTDLGLISVLPATTLILLFLLTVSFCLTLARPVPPWVPLAHVLVLIAMLYGVTAFLESEPRSAPVWRHVGVIDYIARNDSVDPSIDAYFSWPGFFGLGTLVTEAAGFASPLAMAGWGPLAFNLLFLAPLTAILRWASDDRRVIWLGVWVFYSINWVGQDYMSPQAVGYTLWLSMLAVLLTWFTPRPATLAGPPSARGLLRLLDPRRPGPESTVRMEILDPSCPPHRRAGLAITVVALFAAIVTGHQLTPFLAVLAVTGLVLFARMELRLLPVLMVVLLGAWLSFMTTDYLAGHLHVVAGPVLSVATNLNEGVAARISGSSEHEFIVHVRVLSSAAIAALALAGLARRLLSRRADVALVVIAASPLALPLIQPYGGEMILRVFLFALPAIAFFIASLAFPSLSAGRDRLTLAVVAIVCCALIGCFQYTRYGNERLDHFTRGDVAAVDALYRVAPPGATLIGFTNIPWRQRRYASYEYRQITDLESWQDASPNPRRLATDIRRVSAPKGVYVIVTRSTRIAAALLMDKPGVLDGLVRVLRDAPYARQVHRGRDGDVFHIDG